MLCARDGERDGDSYKNRESLSRSQREAESARERESKIDNDSHFHVQRHPDHYREEKTEHTNVPMRCEPHCTVQLVAVA
jgi:hypothetical protein